MLNFYLREENEHEVKLYCYCNYFWSIWPSTIVETNFGNPYLCVKSLRNRKEHFKTIILCIKCRNDLGMVWNYLEEFGLNDLKRGAKPPGTNNPGAKWLATPHCYHWHYDITNTWLQHYCHIITTLVPQYYHITTTLLPQYYHITTTLLPHHYHKKNT